MLLQLRSLNNQDYGDEYSLDTSNITWGNASNDSHVFDIFSEYSTHRDSTKTRLDMLTFVASNNQRYKWDCHVFFSMHGVYLDTWLKQMSYWGTKADELAIYALSDMLKVHSFIVTKNRPWTTVDASVQGTPMDILHMCPVKLAYLGENRFGRLWRRLQPLHHVSTNQTDLLPVFPDAQAIDSNPAPPTTTEIETAETLLTMHDALTFDQYPPEQEANNTILELQEPTVTASTVTELILDKPIEPKENPREAVLTDAMDKIVAHEDVSFVDPYHWLKYRDCMDLITGRISDFVEAVNLDSLFVMDVKNTSRIEQIGKKLKPCRVELVRIAHTPTVKLPTLQTNQDLLSLGEYFTRSKVRQPQLRKKQKTTTCQC